jgi:hypothetical protein
VQGSCGGRLELAIEVFLAASFSLKSDRCDGHNHVMSHLT